MDHLTWLGISGYIIATRRHIMWSMDTCAAKLVGFALACATGVGAGPFAAPSIAQGLPSTAKAQTPISTPSGQRFFEDRERGWHWYEQIPDFEEAPVVPPAPAVAPAQAEEKVAPTQKTEAAPAPAGPPPMSTAWIRENLGRYRDAAIDDPSPEKVRAYLYLQRVMLDKASVFTETSNKVVAADPALDENNVFPKSTFGAQTAVAMASAQKELILRNLAKEGGLWFFYESTCEFCQIQAPLVQAFAKRYGFSVLAISLDGKPLPGGEFPAFRTDRGQAQKLGIETTPALVLALPPDRLAPATQGLAAADELSERVVQVAIEHGWVTSKEAQRAQISRHNYVGADVGNAMSEETLADPKRLAEHIRAQLKKPAKP